MNDRYQGLSLIFMALFGGSMVLAAPVSSPHAINVRSPQLHRLDPKYIAEAERRPWQPAELVAVLGDQSGRHWQNIQSISYSPDGKWIATNSGGLVYVWVAPDLRFHALLPIEASLAQFVPEKSALLTCSKDGIVQLWDVNGAKPRSRVVASDVLSSYQRALRAAAGRKNLEVIGYDISPFVLSPDGKKLIVPKQDGFSFYDLSISPTKCSYVSLGKLRSLLEAGFSPDSRSLVTVKGEVDWSHRGYFSGPIITKHEVIFWDVSGDKPKLRYGLSGLKWWQGPIVFSPDGKTLVCGANILDLSSDKPKFRGTMKGDKEDVQDRVEDPRSRKIKDDEQSIEEENIRACLFLPGSRYALTTGRNPYRSRGGYIRVRDMNQRETRILQTIRSDHAYYSYHALALSPDGKRLAVGQGNYLHLWEMKDEKIQMHPPSPGHTQDVKAMSFGACGNLLATIARDATLRLWDLDGSRPRERLVHKQKNGYPWDTVALSPDCTKLTANIQRGSDGFTLWEISRSGLRVLVKHYHDGRFMRFSPGSKMLFASDGHYSHIFYDVSKPMEPAESLRLGWIGGHHFAGEAIAFSPDWQTLAFGGNYELQLWQRKASGWEERLSFQANCHIQSMSFGGSGTTLLVGGGTYKKPQVHLYDLSGESPKPIIAFIGLRDVALSVTASSTGKLFAATDATGRVVVWSLSGKKLHEWTFPGPVHCVAFAPDGRHLALGNGDGTVYILRLNPQMAK